MVDADPAFSADHLAWLPERAELEGLDRADFVRLVADYAMLTMPPGWRSETDWNLRWRRATIEAQAVARRLAKKEASQPGYVDRLAALPPEQQTAKIRAEVYPDARAAYLPEWFEGYVVVYHDDKGSAAVAKI